MLLTTMEEIFEHPGQYRANVYYRNGRKQSRRVLVEPDMRRFGVWDRRRRTLGRFYFTMHDEVTAIEPVIQAIQPEAVKWQKSWEKAQKMLEESGLWGDLLEEIRTGLDIGFEKICKAYGLYWEYSHKDESQCIRLIREVDPRLVSISEEGKEYANTSIIWVMNVPAKIKKMYFGKRDNNYYLGRIAYAMENEEKYETPRVVAGYDVSFEYNPDVEKAWYREGFRGCGNGHYYYALNATHALFSEDD